jgi:hypothetical protein
LEEFAGLRSRPYCYLSKAELAANQPITGLEIGGRIFDFFRKFSSITSRLGPADKNTLRKRLSYGPEVEFVAVIAVQTVNGSKCERKKRYAERAFANVECESIWQVVRAAGDSDGPTRTCEAGADSMIGTREPFGHVRRGVMRKDFDRHGHVAAGTEDDRMSARNNPVSDGLVCPKVTPIFYMCGIADIDLVKVRHDR